MAKKTYWLDVIDWCYNLGRDIYYFLQENPFPKRKDYIKGDENGTDDRGSGEDSGGDFGSRNGEVVVETEQSSVS